MTWVAWALIAYVVIDRVSMVAMICRSVDLTPSLAVTSLVTGSLIVWAVLVLAGVA